MKNHLSNIAWNPPNAINAEHATVPKDCGCRETELHVTDRCSHNSNPNTSAPNPKRITWKNCCNFIHSGKKVFQYYVQTTWIFLIFLNRLTGNCFCPPLSAHNSLNIGCYIKEVTNQADGERCHRVSVLAGHRLSLREPTSSALTSTNRAHNRVVQCTQSRSKRWQTCIEEDVNASTCSRILIYFFCIHSNTHSQGINVKGDSVQSQACVDEGWEKEAKMETHLDVFGSVSYPWPLLGQNYFEQKWRW